MTHLSLLHGDDLAANALDESSRLSNVSDDVDANVADDIGASVSDDSSHWSYVSYDSPGCQRIR